MNCVSSISKFQLCSTDRKLKFLVILYVSMSCNSSALLHILTQSSVKYFFCTLQRSSLVDIGNLAKGCVCSGKTWVQYCSDWTIWKTEKQCCGDARRTGDREEFYWKIIEWNVNTGDAFFRSHTKISCESIKNWKSPFSRYSIHIDPGTFISIFYMSEFIGIKVCEIHYHPNNLCWAASVKQSLFGYWLLHRYVPKYECISMK